MKSKSISATPAGCPKFYLQHAGRQFRIFKRQAEATAPWYIYFELDGQRYKHCLDTSLKDPAVVNARQYVDAVLTARHSGREDLLDAFRCRRAPVAPTWSTLGQVLAAFERAPAVIGEGHRRQVGNNFRWAARKVFGEDANTEALRLDEVLTKDFVRRFFETVGAGLSERPQEEQQRVMRSANSMFNSGRCLFRPKLVEHYRGQGLTVPDVADFMTAWEAHRFERLGRVAYDAPPEAVVQATLEAAQDFPRNEFCGVSLALAFGLRVGEIAQARWGWLTHMSNQPCLNARAEVKNHTNHIHVVALDPYFQRFMQRVQREGWRTGPDDFILTGTPHQRETSLLRSAAEMLDNLGWRTHKKLHELRKYSGSQVAMKWGLYQASIWLRHSSMAVTQAHYTTYLDRMQMIKPETVPVQWAALVQAAA